jgi:ribose/xylose/arabinose/galactoside ABC-type transport system permease subunit
MNAVTTAVPTAVTASGLPLALTIAFAVTALVAIGMVVAQLRRTSRLTPIVGGLGAASAAGILAVAIFVGVSVSGGTVPPASVDSTSSTNPSDVQLPTLDFDE